MPAIAALLFTDAGTGVFAILDGASVPGLLEKLRSEAPEYECLYPGELPPDLAAAAPYLVRLERDAEFAAWLFSQGWAKHWGVFALSPAEFRTLRQHFRRFLVVHDPQARPLYFRFYDPRVLATYLPACNREELEDFFGPVAAYVMEGGSAAVALRFMNRGGELFRKEEPVEPG